MGRHAGWVDDAVRAAYDALAPLYASLFLRDLDGDTDALAWLADFANLAAHRTGSVADLGCGPGHVVDHLAGLGLSVIGLDLSPGQIAEARKAFPLSTFQVGDLTALALADSSLGGIVSRYSLIHLPPDRLGAVFEEWLRVLEPAAPVLVSFFGSTSAEAHGTPFDHRVATAYELFPATVAHQMGVAGFRDLRIGTRPPPVGGRPLDQATILATSPAP